MSTRAAVTSQAFLRRKGEESRHRHPTANAQRMPTFTRTGKGQPRERPGRPSARAVSEGASLKQENARFPPSSAHVFRLRQKAGWGMPSIKCVRLFDEHLLGARNLTVYSQIVLPDEWWVVPSRRRGAQARDVPHPLLAPGGSPRRCGSSRFAPRAWPRALNHGTSISGPPPSSYPLPANSTRACIIHRTF